MKIRVITTTARDSHEAALELSAELDLDAGLPDFVALYSTAAHDVATIQATASNWGVTALHGATSRLGVMSADGLQSNDGFGVGAFCIWDSEGYYGSAMRPVGDNPEAAAKAATIKALESAGRPGESPDIIWLAASPKNEEAALRGIAAAVGDNVPVIGGTAADNDGSSSWRVFDNDGIEAEGIVISVMFPTDEFSFAYHNGYAPTKHTGTVTKAEGRRVYEIDGEPAVAVYDRWTEGTVLQAEPSSGPTPILLDSTLKPLGKYLESIGDVPYYLLAHPSRVYPDGSIELAAAVFEGDRLLQMIGNADSLIRRPGKVASLAVRMGGPGQETIKGALMVICTGGLRTIMSDIDATALEVRKALGGAPFLSVFAYGEQGMALDGINRHSNLMISCLAFS